MVQLDLGCLATHLSIFVSVCLSLSLNPHNSNRNTRIKLHRSLHQQKETQTSPVKPTQHMHKASKIGQRQRQHQDKTRQEPLPFIYDRYHVYMIASLRFKNNRGYTVYVNPCNMVIKNHFSFFMFMQ